MAGSVSFQSKVGRKTNKQKTTKFLSRNTFCKILLICRRRISKITDNSKKKNISSTLYLLSVLDCSDCPSLLRLNASSYRPQSPWKRLACILMMCLSTCPSIPQPCQVSVQSVANLTMHQRDSQQTDRQTDKQTNARTQTRQPDRQIGRQAGTRQADRHTDRQAHTHTRTNTPPPPPPPPAHTYRQASLLHWALSFWKSASQSIDLLTSLIFQIDSNTDKRISSPTTSLASGLWLSNTNHGHAERHTRRA